MLNQYIYDCNIARYVGDDATAQTYAANGGKVRRRKMFCKNVLILFINFKDNLRIYPRIII